MHISPYDYTREEQDPLRPKKLLLHRSEIRHIEIKISQRGYALVPLKIYFNKRNLAKVELGLAKHKKAAGKKQALKERDIKRETSRELRGKF